MPYPPDEEEERRFLTREPDAEPEDWFRPPPPPKPGEPGFRSGGEIDHLLGRRARVDALGRPIDETILRSREEVARLLAAGGGASAELTRAEARRHVSEGDFSIGPVEKFKPKKYDHDRYLPETWFDHGWNSSFGLPAQVLWRSQRSAMTNKIDFWSKEGILDPALIPIAGMFFDHKFDVGADELTDLMGGEKDHMGHVVGTAILMDPLTYMTGGLTSLGRLAKGATHARRMKAVSDTARSYQRAGKLKAGGKTFADLMDWADNLQVKDFAKLLKDSRATLMAQKPKRSLKPWTIWKRWREKENLRVAIREFSRTDKANHGLRITEILAHEGKRRIGFGIPFTASEKYLFWKMPAHYNNWFKLVGTATARTIGSPLITRPLMAIPGMDAAIMNPLRNLRGGWKTGDQITTVLNLAEDKADPEMLGRLAHWANRLTGGGGVADRIDSVGIDSVLSVFDEARLGGATIEDAFKAAMKDIAPDNESINKIWGRLTGVKTDEKLRPAISAITNDMEGGAVAARKLLEDTMTAAMKGRDEALEVLSNENMLIKPDISEWGKLRDELKAGNEGRNALAKGLADSLFKIGEKSKGWLRQAFKVGGEMLHQEQSAKGLIIDLARSQNQVHSLTRRLFVGIQKLADSNEEMTPELTTTLLGAFMRMDILPDELAAVRELASANPKNSLEALRALDDQLDRGEAIFRTLEEVFNAAGIEGDILKKLSKSFNEEVFTQLPRLNEQELAVKFKDWARTLSEEAFEFTPEQAKRMERSYNKHTLFSGTHEGQQVGALSDDALQAEYKRAMKSALRATTDKEAADILRLNPVVTDWVKAEGITVEELLEVARRETLAPATPSTTKPGVEGFMEAYLESSKVNPSGGDRYWQVKRTVEKKAYDFIVQTDVRPARRITGGKGEEIHIRSISTNAPGFGSGTEVMNRILKIADEAGVTVHLDAVPFGYKTLTKTQLMKWYRKFGFKGVRRTGLMVRAPKAVKKVKGAPKTRRIKRPGATKTLDSAKLRAFLNHLKESRIAVEGSEVVGDLYTILRGKGKTMDSSLFLGADATEIPKGRYTQLDWDKLVETDAARRHSLENGLKEGDDLYEVANVPTKVKRNRRVEDPRLLAEQVPGEEGDVMKLILGLGQEKAFAISDDRLSEIAISWMSARHMIKEYKTFLRRSMKLNEGHPENVPLHPEYLDKIAAHMQEIGGRARDLALQHLPKEFMKLFIDVQGIQGTIFNESRRMGIWKIGSPIGYIGRYFSEKGQMAMGRLIGEIDGMSPDILTRLGSKSPHRYKRNITTMTIEEINEQYNQLHELQKEFPALKKWLTRADKIMKDEGLKFKGSFWSPRSQLRPRGEGVKSFWRERVSTDPILGLMMRLSEASGEKSLEKYFETLFDATNKVPGESSMLGGKVVAILDSGGKPVGGIKSLKSKTLDKMIESEAWRRATTREEISEVSPTYIVILSDDGGYHIVDAALAGDTLGAALGVMPLGRFADEVETGVKATTAQAFVRASNRSDLFNSMLDPGQLAGEEVLHGLMGQHVLAGPQQVIRAAIETAAQTLSVAHPALRAYDNVNYMIKGFQTIYRPGFHVSNLASGVFQALHAGVRPDHLISAYVDTLAILFGDGEAARLGSMITTGLGTGGVKFKGKTLRTPSLQFLDAVRELGPLTDDIQINDFLRANLHKIPSAEIQLGGGRTVSWFDFARAANAGHLYGTYSAALRTGSATVSTSLLRAKVLALAGEGSRIGRWVTKTVDKGNRIAEVSEFVNRTATAIGLLRSGHSLEMAVDLTRGAHVPYEQLTIAERALAKRSIGFYTFARHYTPWAWMKFMEDPAKLSVLAHSIMDNKKYVDVSGDKPTGVLGEKRYNIARMNANIEAMMLPQAFAERFPKAIVDTTSGDEFSTSLLRDEPSASGLLSLGGIAGIVTGGAELFPTGSRLQQKKGWTQHARDATWPIKIAFQLAGLKPSREDLSPYVDYTPIEAILADTDYGLGIRKVRPGDELLRARARYKGLERKIKLRHEATDDKEVKADLEGYLLKLQAELTRLEKIAKLQGYGVATAKRLNF